MEAIACARRSLTGSKRHLSLSARLSGEYEAKFSLMHKGGRDPVICTYDLTRFSGDVIMGVLRTHPMVILGGVLQENPFFVPPEQFLQELRERHVRDGLQPAAN